MAITKLVSGSLGTGVGGSLIKISTQTISSAVASVNFTSGIDNTYDKYIFTFLNIVPSTDASRLQVKFSTDGGSTYAATILSNFYFAAHNEADTDTTFAYDAGLDTTSGTAHTLTANIGSDADQSSSGYFGIYNPASTTKQKTFYSNCQTTEASDFIRSDYTGGYVRTVNPVDAIQFLVHSGDIESGSITLHGIKL